MPKYIISRNEDWIEDIVGGNAISTLEEWLDEHGLDVINCVDGGDDYAFAYVVTELGQPNLYEAIYDDRDEEEVFWNE